MSNLLNRVFDNLKQRRQNILEGKINCIEFPFPRFRTIFPGIEKGKYYLISGATKSSKTQLTNYIFVYTTVIYAYTHPNIITPKIFYYNLEETEEAITLRFICFLLYIYDNIRISPTDLGSTNKDKPVDKHILDLIQTKKYTDILNFYEQVVEFKDDKSNPTAIWKDIKSYANLNGVTYYKPCLYKNELGETKEGQEFDYYIPNNPNEYVFIIVDHISLIDTENNKTLRECINRLSSYMILIKNRYKYIPVIVQQQSTETTNLEAFKSNKIRPTTAGLSDSKYTSKDCDVFMGITNPHFFELPDYVGYDITKLKSNFRILEIVLNRQGDSNNLCPLYFDGAINYYKELPLPSDKERMESIYNLITRNKLGNFVNKVPKSLFSLIAYSIKFIIKPTKNN
jgi:hypothetical protein